MVGGPHGGQIKFGSYFAGDGISTGLGSGGDAVGRDGVPGTMVGGLASGELIVGIPIKGIPFVCLILVLLSK